MKKKLLLGFAVSSLLIGFSSCSHDSDGVNISQVESDYRANFVKTFGQPASNQDWGFGTATENARMTRSVTVNGDTYDVFNFPTNEEIAAAFPTSIPSGAEEIATNGDYNYYYSRGAGKNYQITSAGTYNIGGGWMNKSQDQTQLLLYNVYVNVPEGSTVTISRNGDPHFNLYILSGNVTLTNNFGEMGGLISVAEGATLNDNRTRLACNNGIKLFNRGTVNTGSYDIGNNAAVYNEATFTASGDLSYSAGAGNTSYFINMGDDCRLTAATMTMNSTCHFFTDGIVNIIGETKVTQNEITWINNGHYTTNTMVFSAKNGTFYNYCQLIVKNQCNFTDGLFNMMQNSYAEIGYGLFNNFRVNMANNSGFNVKFGSKWGRQGADFIGEHQMQGFVATNDNAKVYVRLGGLAQVPAYKGYAFNVQGANLTLAYDEMKFYKGYNEIGIYTRYDNVSYWEETTAEQLEANQDEDKTWNLHNVTKIVTGDDFDLVTVNTVQGQCAATWYIPGGEGGGEQPVPTIRVIAEDLSAAESSDFDFNDVVFDVTYTSETTATITLQAAGGTLPLTVADREVHQLFNVTTNVMVNTVRDASKSQGAQWASKDPVSFDISGIDMSQNGKDIQIKVQKGGVWYTLEAQEGVPAAKIAVKPTFTWCDEFEAIETRYPKFKDWVQNKDVIWY